MKEARGDMFTHLGIADAVCITTNGFTKRNGQCVMGRGCAAQAAKRFPWISSELGTLIRQEGNQVHNMWTAQWAVYDYDLMDELDDDQIATAIVSFPVKPVSWYIGPEWISKDYDQYIVRRNHMGFRVGDTVPGWACVASIRLIKRSAQQLVELANTQGWNNVILPRPGCGAGELKWSRVKLDLETILDDRFTCITY